MYVIYCKMYDWNKAYIYNDNFVSFTYTTQRFYIVFIKWNTVESTMLQSYSLKYAIQIFSQNYLGKESNKKSFSMGVREGFIKNK